MKQIIILLIMIISAIPVFAEIKTITLSNALELAIKNNLAISQAEQEIGISEAQYGQAMADFAMPTVSAAADFTELDPTTVQNGIISLPIPVYNPKVQQIVPVNVGPLTNVYPDNYHTGISITKPVFAGFRFWNTLGIRQLTLDLARVKLADKKREVISSVTISFYNLFLIKENTKMFEELNRSLKDHVDFAKNNYISGNATEYDYIRANVQYKINQPHASPIKQFIHSRKIGAMPANRS